MAKNDLNWVIVKKVTIFRKRDQKIRNQQSAHQKLKYQRFLPLESTIYTSGLMRDHWANTFSLKNGTFSFFAELDMPED